MPFPTVRASLSLLLAASAAVGLSACGSSSQGAATSSSLVGKATVDIPAGTVLNVGDQQQNLQTQLQASGALSGAPYKVNFVEFNSGPLVDAGFAAHSIDIGYMGDLPASLAVKSGLPVKAVALFLPVGASLYLLARPGITSISQLRGKAVAYTTGTAEQAIALRALASVGLKQKDVHQVNVSLLQLGTVLQSGAADASVVSVEQKVDYEQTHPGAKVLAIIDTLKPPSYDYLLGTKAALGDPAKAAAISDLTRRLIKAANWQKTHRSQWITDYYVTVQHQAPAAARQILAAGGTANYVPLNTTVQSALQDVVKLMAGAGALGASYSVAPLFDRNVSQRYDNILKEVPQRG
jgi:sulfonate transport system substrate-binding protein